MRLVRIVWMLIQVAFGVYVVAIAWPLAAGQIPAAPHFVIGVRITLAILPVILLLQMIGDMKKLRELWTS